jgi:hypothetical protein
VLSGAEVARLDELVVRDGGLDARVVLDPEHVVLSGAEAARLDELVVRDGGLDARVVLDPEHVVAARLAGDDGGDDGPPGRRRWKREAAD